MSPELFKYKPYSYKSDIWALGCVLYELCSQKHAFDAQSLNGLAVKIMKGSYLPVGNTFSKGVKDLVCKNRFS
jgi:non-specific serine/threonine protein kinase/NIMA (never in mitosis gene a)-related kinase